MTSPDPVRPAPEIHVDQHAADVRGKLVGVEESGASENGPNENIEQVVERVEPGGQVIAKQTNIERLINVFTGEDARRAQRNRAAMLQKVRHDWVEGVLEPERRGGALIALDKVSQPDAIRTATPAPVITPTIAEPFRRDQRTIELFEHSDQALLILGAPGSGKTTFLLELADDAIARAGADARAPIPVVFTLSSWQGEQSLADWLVAELRKKYGVDGAIGRPWVAGDELLLLLDGLDEVGPDWRAGCVEAINAWRQAHGLCGIAVTCRAQEYDALPVRLQLEEAILLQPLAATEIDEFLARQGSPLGDLRAALANQPSLQAMAQTPLLLNMLCQAYQHAQADVLGLAQIDSPDDRRTRLLALYVHAMFKQVGDLGDVRYPQPRTERWLGGLARQMLRHGQTQFLVEQLQPSWLSGGAQVWAYALGSRLLVGSAMTLILLGVFALFSELILPGRISATIGIVGTLTAGVLAGIRLRRSQQHAKTQPAPEAVRQHSVLDALGTGIICGLMISVADAFWFGSLFGFSIDGFLGFALLGLVCGGTIIGLTFGLRASGYSIYRDIHTFESVVWDWPRALRGVVNGFVLGLLIPFVLLALGDLSVGQGLAQSIAYLPDLFAFAVLVTGVAGGLLAGLGGKRIHETVRVNQGVYASARNALVYGLGVTAVLAATTTVFVLLVEDPYTSRLETLFWIVMLSVVLGVIGALSFGGIAVAQHAVLRVLLARNGNVPLQLTPFLDFAAQRRLLQKVGGGYIFYHPLLKEYFAALGTG